MAYRIQYKKDIFSSWHVVGTTSGKSEAVKTVKQMKNKHPSLMLCVFDLSTKEPVLSI